MNDRLIDYPTSRASEVNHHLYFSAPRWDRSCRFCKPKACPLLILQASVLTRSRHASPSFAHALDGSEDFIGDGHGRKGRSTNCYWPIDWGSRRKRHSFRCMASFLWPELCESSELCQSVLLRLHCFFSHSILTISGWFMSMSL